MQSTTASRAIRWRWRAAVLSRVRIAGERELYRRFADDGSGAPGSTSLHFAPIATFDVRMFADLGRKPKLVEKIPFLKGSRVSLSIDNVFNAQQRVTDDSGTVPLRYNPGFLDPRGRVFELEFRKQF